MPLQKRNKVARAFLAANNQGAECLFNDFRQYGNYASQAAQNLTNHLNNPSDVYTQVCCGDGPCADRLNRTIGRNNYDDDPPNRSARAVSPHKGDTRGTLRIFDHALNWPQLNLSNVFFHELLHRIGLPISKIHNIIGEEVNPIVVNGELKCPTHSGLELVLEDGRCLPLPNLTCEREFFMAQNSADRPYNLAVQYDPVYACALACFHSDEMANRQDDNTLQNARQTCGRFAAHGNFSGHWGIDDLPTPSGSSAQNICQ